MIVLNARFLSQEMSGVQRFAAQTCLALQKLRDDLIFVTPRQVRMTETARQLNAVSVGRNSGHLWEQVDLPLYLVRQGRPLLISLGSTAPLMYGNQIATHHDITYVRHPESYSWPFRTSYKLMTPIMLKRIRTLITVSQFSRREISEHYGFPQDRILVVPNAVGNEFQPPLWRRSQPPYLLAVSSPSAHKNFGRMIAAFLRLKLTQRVELHIVGAATHVFADPDLQRLAASDSRVRFLGRLSDLELIEQYQHAAAFVFPSLYEGFGIPPLEAQACGCPVLAANSASIPEVLQASALYFDPLDIEHITQAMALVLNNRQVRQQLRSMGLANVERFSWEDSAQRISNCIDARLAAPQPRERT